MDEGFDRENQSVYTEIPIVYRVPKITTISPVFNTILIYFGYALIYPVPYKPTLKAMVAFNRIPVFLQVTDTVSHRMGILTHNKGAVIRFIFSVSNNI